MTKFLSKYFKPSQISIIYIALAIISIFMLTIFFSNASEKKNREYYEKPIKTVISAKETRRIGLDSVNKKVIGLNKETQDLTSKVSKIEASNKKLKSESKSSVALAKEVGELKDELAKQKESASKAAKEQDEKIKNAVEYALKELKVTETLNRTKHDRTTQDPDSSKATPFVKRKQSPDSVFNYGSTSEKTSQATGQDEYHEADGRSDSLFVVIEEPYSAVEDEAYKIYLPLGSILTGVTVTGMDAPTSSASSESPLPVLIRIKKEAILPNLHNLEEVRECFALMAGYGDLASERAYLRGENISCMREDGLVIETGLAAYAVGEDGKAGLKGTLVSRNSKVLINSMAAGFMEGLAGAFNVTPVPVISTNPTGQQDYQSVFDPAALQGGAAKGAATSFEKLADYYMDLADAMHPVIEVGAGRVVDIIITKGMSL